MRSGRFYGRPLSVVETAGHRGQDVCYRLPEPGGSPLISRPKQICAKSPPEKLEALNAGVNLREFLSPGDTCSRFWGPSLRKTDPELVGKWPLLPRLQALSLRGFSDIQPSAFAITHTPSLAFAGLNCLINYVGSEVIAFSFSILGLEPGTRGSLERLSRAVLSYFFEDLFPRM
ncbi:Hypothetical protein NTJ_05005 [Nesidiocoris tenuis]|uniref:Uncharacterized protein n=1 Tax=Nesidiocoris tenuis TaxID=355587 RepID=A0ABN7AP74_9HEMI|nr:Hypothetical protein NTJ_05005 [Nesidiocoris tenuis]